MAVAHILLVGDITERHEEIVTHISRAIKIEALGHHADHCPALAVVHDRLTNQVRIAAEPSLPEAMTDHHDSLAAGPVLLFIEEAPDLRLHAERRKETRCHQTPYNALRLAL